MAFSAADLTQGSDDAQPEQVPGKEIHGRSPSRLAYERLRSDKVAVASFLVILFFLLIAIGAPLWVKLLGLQLTPDSGALLTDLDATTMPAIGPPYNGFIWEHPLGIAPQTAEDNLAQWIYGARTSIAVATISSIGATFLGVVIGLVAGFSRGWADRVLSWFIDVFIALPFLLVALVIAPMIVTRFSDRPDALTVAQFASLMIVLATFTWMPLARLIRGQVLSLREAEFIEAARMIGVPTRTILRRELLPNLVAPIVVSISLGLPAFVTAEAALAFLGVGVTNAPSWGQTIDRATGYFSVYPLYLWAPVLGVLLLVIALNLFGDAVRDAFDPKTRR